MREEKGVTLVALVVTIIILLILAGITISLTIGEDGIITKAQQAGKNYLNAQEYEQQQLAEFTNQTENIINNTTGGRNPYNGSEFRKSIVAAITDAGVETSEEDNDETIIANIGRILQERTKGATATAEDILEGKTAYVNGELITGKNTDAINKSAVYYLGTSKTFNIKELLPNVDYTSLTNKNFIAQIDKSYQYVVASYISGTSHNTAPNASIQGSDFSYDASTGILNFSGYTLNSSIANSAIGYYSSNKDVITHVYLIVGEIIDATI